MTESKHALIIANDRYDDQGLKKLRAPAQDAAALAEVLHDPEIGDFEVEVIRNEPAHVTNRRIQAFFNDRRRDDTLLLHFSCHGLKSESGELYFAASDTDPRLLDATAVPAHFVRRVHVPHTGGQHRTFPRLLLRRCLLPGVGLRTRHRRSERPRILPGREAPRRAGQGRHHGVQLHGVRLRGPRPRRELRSAAVGVHPRGGAGAGERRGGSRRGRRDHPRRVVRLRLRPRSGGQREPDAEQGRGDGGGADTGTQPTRPHQDRQGPLTAFADGRHPQRQRLHPAGRRPGTEVPTAERVPPHRRRGTSGPGGDRARRHPADRRPGGRRSARDPSGALPGPSGLRPGAAGLDPSAAVAAPGRPTPGPALRGPVLAVVAAGRAGGERTDRPVGHVRRGTPVR
jgi:hypothetical protein